MQETGEVKIDFVWNKNEKSLNLIIKLKGVLLELKYVFRFY